MTTGFDQPKIFGPAAWRALVAPAASIGVANRRAGGDDEAPEHGAKHFATGGLWCFWPVLPSIRDVIVTHRRACHSRRLCTCLSADPYRVPTAGQMRI